MADTTLEEKRAAVRSTTRRAQSDHRAWDPYGLSRAGEIADEWTDDVWEILIRLPDTTSDTEVVELVAEVLGRSFPDWEFNGVTCASTGARIAAWWRG